jgi:EmrB/QacA subfamily drug resistance transporter
MRLHRALSITNQAEQSKPPSETLPHAQSNFKISFTGILLAIIVSSLDQNIVATALPYIAGELGEVADLSWIVTAFMLTSTISTPIYGKLSDMYGRRRLFAVSFAIFLSSSILCSMVETLPELIVARAIQGLGAGGLVTLSQSAIGDLVGPRQRGRYQGFFSGALAFSTVAGPLLGGVLISDLSWRWVFVATIPLGIASWVSIYLGLPPAPRIKSHDVDYLGALLLAAGTTAAFLLLSSVGAGTASRTVLTAVFGAGAVVCLGLFPFQELRAAEPLVDLSLFRNANFAIGVVAAGMMAFAMNGAMVFLPLYFQYVQGQTPTHAGLMLLPQIAGMIISSIVGGRLSARSGEFKTFLLVGVGCEFLALTLLASFAALDFGQLPFVGALAILGIGTGLGMPNATVVVQNAVPHARLGIATASMSFLRALGGAVGVALSGFVMHHVLTALSSDLSSLQTISEVQRGTMLPQNYLEHGELVEPLWIAIASGFALGASMMLAAFITVLRLPPVRRSFSRKPRACLVTKPKSRRPSPSCCRQPRPTSRGHVSGSMAARRTRAPRGSLRRTIEARHSRAFIVPSFRGPSRKRRDTCWDSPMMVRMLVYYFVVR